MKYGVYGPFEVIRHGNIVSRAREEKSRFWQAVEDHKAGLSAACGCYVLIIRGRAWYVGLAERQSFRQECFAAHKIVQYDAALNEVQGVPSLLLIAKLTPGSAFSAPSRNGYKDVRLLE